MSYVWRYQREAPAVSLAENIKFTAQLINLD